MLKFMNHSRRGNDDGNHPTKYHYFNLVSYITYQSLSTQETETETRNR